MRFVEGREKVEDGRQGRAEARYIGSEGGGAPAEGYLRTKAGSVLMMMGEMRLVDVVLV